MSSYQPSWMRGSAPAVERRRHHPGTRHLRDLAGAALRGIHPAYPLRRRPPPQVPVGQQVAYYGIFGALLIANLAVFFIGRSEEERLYGELTRSYWSYKWTVALAAGYFVATLAL